MTFRLALVTLKPSDALPAVASPGFRITALRSNAVRMAVAGLASAVRIPHRIAEVASLAALAQTSGVSWLADAAHLSVPDITAAGKVAVGLRTRTSLTAVR